MKEKISQLIAAAEAAVTACGELTELEEVKVAFCGKSGKLTALLKGLKELPSELRPEAGKFVNEARDRIAALIAERKAVLADKLLARRMERERIDVTLSGPTDLGSLHPCTHVLREMLDIFTSLGFRVAEGPEIETDWFNFQALNLPADHPARDMQDTFYVGETTLLRTHTSPVQIHTMLEEKPPLRVVCPGKVYRSDDDATHSPMFQQIEGLAVDEHVTMCDLKGVLETFAQALFDKRTKTRLRPSYFPFTEPSVEVDVTCSVCHGKGCKICKGTGWIEILGAGIVHPKVLENCGIDSNRYSGFAFGCGIERIAMIKYGIPDMRILFENDVRFLKEFK